MFTNIKITKNIGIKFLCKIPLKSNCKSDEAGETGKDKMLEGKLISPAIIPIAVVAIIAIRIEPLTLFCSRIIIVKKHKIPIITGNEKIAPASRGMLFCVKLTIPISFKAIKIKNKPSPIQYEILMFSGICFIMYSLMFVSVIKSKSKPQMKIPVSAVLTGTRDLHKLCML